MALPFALTEKEIAAKAAIDKAEMVPYPNNQMGIPDMLTQKNSYLKDAIKLLTEQIALYKEAADNFYGNGMYGGARRRRHRRRTMRHRK